MPRNIRGFLQVPNKNRIQKRSLIDQFYRTGHPIFLPVVAFLAICFLFGGGKASPNIQYYIIFVFGSLLVAFLFRDGIGEDFRNLTPGMKLFLLITLLLPILQLTPLPPSVWQLLEGRETENSLRAIVGFENEYFPLTLAPIATIQFLLSLLILHSLFLACLTLSITVRQTIFTLIVIFAVLTISIGMVQAATGGSVLDFYSNSHRGFLLGSFANRNHAALFLAISIVCFLNIVFSKPDSGIGRTIFGVLGVILLLSAIAATGSRMGLALGLVAAFSSTLLFWDPAGRKSRKTIFAFLGLGVAATLALASSAIVSRTVDRFDSVSGDQRWAIWQDSVDLGREYAPLGVGIGGFEGAYAKREDIADLRPEFVNNAHNDYIEVFIESGWPGAVVLVFSIIFISYGVYRAVISPRGMERNQRLTGGLMLFLIFVHSVVDYPMRRMFIASIAFFALACLFQNKLIRTK